MRAWVGYGTSLALVFSCLCWAAGGGRASAQFTGPEAGDLNYRASGYSECINIRAKYNQAKAATPAGKKALADVLAKVSGCLRENANLLNTKPGWQARAHWWIEESKKAWAAWEKLASVEEGLGRIQESCQYLREKHKSARTAVPALQQKLNLLLTKVNACFQELAGKADLAKLRQIIDEADDALADYKLSGGLNVIDGPGLSDEEQDAAFEKCIASTCAGNAAACAVCNARYPMSRVRAIRRNPTGDVAPVDGKCPQHSVAMGDPPRCLKASWATASKAVDAWVADQMKGLNELRWKVAGLWDQAFSCAGISPTQPFSMDSWWGCTANDIVTRSLKSGDRRLLARGGLDEEIAVSALRSTAQACVDNYRRQVSDWISLYNGRLKNRSGWVKAGCGALQAMDDMGAWIEKKIEEIKKWSEKSLLTKILSWIATTVGNGILKYLGLDEIFETAKTVVEGGTAVMDFIAGFKGELAKFALGKAFDKIKDKVIDWLTDKLIEFKPVRNIAVAVVEKGVTLGFKALNWMLAGPIAGWISAIIALTPAAPSIPFIPFAVKAILNWLGGLVGKALGNQVLELEFVKKQIKKQVVGRLVGLILKPVEKLIESLGKEGGKEAGKQTGKEAPAAPSGSGAKVIRVIRLPVSR
jgi:hypothetical protein